MVKDQDQDRNIKNYYAKTLRLEGLISFSFNCVTKFGRDRGMDSHDMKSQD